MREEDDESRMRFHVSASCSSVSLICGQGCFHGFLVLFDRFAGFWQHRHGVFAEDKADVMALTGDNKGRILLASASPRRYQLLEQIGITPDFVLAPSIDETPRLRERPRLYVERMAREKAAAAHKASRHDEVRAAAIIIAADTVVALGARILPKTDTVEEAEQCLRALSGRAHRVYTSVVVMKPSGQQTQRLVETRLRFRRIPPVEIEAYLAAGEWRGKAGGYAIQGLAGSFVTRLIGSYSGVVGLPLYEATALLGGAGLKLAAEWHARA
jgi:septum formation protein